MLKNSLFMLVMVFILAACGGQEKTADDTKKVEKKAEVKGLTDGTYALAADSKVDWKGSATVKSHVGTINVSKGEFKVEKGVLSAGSFDLDMASIVNTDLDEASGKLKLEGHLKTADFFDAEQFPTASFAVTKVMAAEGVEGATHTITGDLTIKGKTNPVSFNAMVSEAEGMIITKATLEFDRSKWGVEYNSASSSAFENVAKDKLINDNIEISFELKGAKAAM